MGRRGVTPRAWREMIIFLVEADLGDPYALIHTTPTGKDVHDIGEEGFVRPTAHSEVPARPCEASIPWRDATVVMRSVRVDQVHSSLLSKTAF